jgi:DNA topoisomerase-3
LVEQTKKKYLCPTDSAYLLIDALPDEMTYPDSTALWENTLHEMAQGSESLEDFLTGQAEFAADLCGKAIGLTMPLQGEHHCPQCGQGVLQQRNGRNGKFWGCSRYPECRASYDDQGDAPKKPDFPCPRCRQGELRLKNGKNGNFWGCTKFPACRATYNDKEGKPALPER